MDTAKVQPLHHERRKRVLPLRVTAIALLASTAVIDLTARTLRVADVISASTRELLGMAAFTPLVILTLLMYFQVRQRTYIRTLFLISITLLIIAQCFDMVERSNLVPQEWMNAVKYVDTLFYSPGSMLVLAACFLGMLEASAAMQRSEEDRRRLKEELDRKSAAEKDLVQARSSLEAVVESRSTELELRHQQLAREYSVRQAAERAAADTENLLKAVVDAAPMFLWAVDADGKITMDSGSGLKLLGLEQGHNVGLNLFELVPENLEALDLARRALHGEACSGYVDFAGLTLRTTYTPLIDPAGEVFGAIGVAIDVTHERELEAKIRQKQKMEAVGALAGGIAHDFNNILYALDGYAALAAKDVAALPRVSEYVAEIRNTVARATDLVDRIMALTRHESVRRIPVDLAQEAENTARLLAPTLPENIKLNLEIACKGKVLGDPAHLRQVLLNLLANASYAMRTGGGALGIRLSEIDLQPGEPKGATSPRFVILEVSDTGPGIESPTRERLFEPFFTTKPEREGSGLGLAIVRSVVDAHGGHIELETANGVGTTFRIVFPACEPDPEPEALAAPEAAVRSEPACHVLVVDDEPRIRFLLRMLLHDAGFEAHVCGSGPDALALLESGALHPDVLLTDLTMPEMDGVELTNRARQILPELPVIICSGYGDGAERANVGALGHAVFLKKPIDSALLEAAILELVGCESARVMA